MPDLRDTLRAPPTRRQFAVDAAFANAMSALAQHERLSAGQVIQALTTQLVSVVQARAMPEEWASAGQEIAEEIRRRLTVVQN